MKKEGIRKQKKINSKNRSSILKRGEKRIEKEKNTRAKRKE